VRVRLDLLPVLRVRLLALCVIAAHLASARVAAQSAQRFSLQGSGLNAQLYGGAFDGLHRGYGFEVQARFTPSAWSFGAGFQFTRHPIAGLDQKLKLYGGFIEPRYVIVVRSNAFAPYVSARFSLLEQKLTVGDVSGSATGVTLNGGGGVLVRLSSRLNLDLGSTYGYTKFGNFVVRNASNGLKVTGPSGSGSNLVVRVGLALGLAG
jgi:opacity protein-like surface antigen